MGVPFGFHPAYLVAVGAVVLILVIAAVLLYFTIGGSDRGSPRDRPKAD